MSQCSFLRNRKLNIPLYQRARLRNALSFFSLTRYTNRAHNEPCFPVEEYTRTCHVQLTTVELTYSLCIRVGDWLLANSLSLNSSHIRRDSSFINERFQIHATIAKAQHIERHLNFNNRYPLQLFMLARIYFI